MYICKLIFSIAANVVVRIHTRRFSRPQKNEVRNDGCNVNYYKMILLEIAPAKPYEGTQNMLYIETQVIYNMDC